MAVLKFLLLLQIVPLVVGQGWPWWQTTTYPTAHRTSYSTVPWYHTTRNWYWTTRHWQWTTRRWTDYTREQPKYDYGYVIAMETSTYSYWYSKQVSLSTYQGGPSVFQYGYASSTSKYTFSDSDTDPISLAVDAVDQALYYMNSDTKAIHRINNFTINVDKTRVAHDVIHEGISNAENQIAFDWISKNIYWTDKYYDWIAMQPVQTNDKTMWKAVIQVSLKSPMALAIAPDPGYIFFSDMQPTPRIERCNLLGEERTTLFVMEDMYPEYIAVDNERRRIYYVNSNDYSVQWISYEGKDSGAIYEGGYYMGGYSSLVYFKDHVCVTSPMMQAVGCTGVTKDYGMGEVLSMFSGSPKVMTVYDKDSQSSEVPSKCTKDVKCDHFCVSTPTGARCVCKEGYTLNDNNRTCSADHILTTKGIIYTTDGTDICVIDIRAINTNSHASQCIVSNLTHAQYLQADSNKGLIYFWNNSTNKLQSYDVTTKRLHDITSTHTVKGVFYDWVDNGLYWSDYSSYSENYIRMIDLQKEESTSTYLYKDENRFEYLTGDPFNFKLFWILKTGSYGYSYKIESASFDGNSRSTIVDGYSLSMPHALAYDQVNNTLFWLDKGSLSSISLNETHSYTKYRFFLDSYGHTLNMYKDYALFVTSKGIRAAYVAGGTLETVVSSRVTGMTYYDQRTQRTERGPCEGNNGGCQHICVPNSVGPKCMCPFGYSLNKDGKKCGSEPLKDQFALILDSEGAMYQIPLNKTKVTSDDVVAVNLTKSDEYFYLHSLAYDSKSKFIYWVHSSNQIRRSKINGENYTTVFKSADDYIGGLAIDQSTGNVYFSAEKSVYDYYGISIYVGVLHFTSNGKVRFRKLPDTESRSHDRTNKIVLHPRKGYMFWVDSAKSAIVRHNMDGTKEEGQEEIVELRDHERYSAVLAIDYEGDRLYWATGFEIQSVDLNGAHLEWFASVVSVSDLVFQGGFLYVSTYDREILKFDKTTKRQVVDWMEKMPDIFYIEAIVLIPGDKQPINAVCGTDNGFCSTFCLPTSDGKTCACEEKVKLRDQRNCENVCDGEIPHGSTQNCYIRPGGVCNYQCDSLYTKNSKVDKITCYANKTWSHSPQTLCEEKRCGTTLPNGKFVDGCEGRIGIHCLFHCNPGFIQKSYKLNTLSCSGKSGITKWNTDINTLCTRAVYCPTRISNGHLISCSKPTSGMDCKVYCNPGYIPFITTAMISCRENGKWNEESNRICRPSSKCPTAWTAGELSANCSGMVYSTCSYRCNKGLVAISKEVKTVICTLSDTWSPPLSTLCKVPPEKINTTPVTARQVSSSTDAGTVAGSTIGVLAVILICVAVVVFLVRRRKRESNPEYKGEPNVFFNAPPVEENTYNQFSNLDVGGLAVMQFENPMTKVESIYDNITEKHVDTNGELKKDHGEKAGKGDSCEEMDNTLNMKM